MTSPPNTAGYWEETQESFDKDIPGLVSSVTYYLRIAQDGDIVQIDDHGDHRQGRITRHENNLVHIELGTKPGLTVSKSIRLIISSPY